MSKHTPGPWRPRNGIVLADSHKGTHCSDADIAFYGGPLVCESICTDANARLIAAAPDLLEVAKKFVAWSEAENNHKSTTFWERIEMVRELDAAAAAAIAKAEGA